MQCQKDLNNTLSAGRSPKLPLPAAALCQELFNTCAAQGDGELDHAVLVKALEVMAAYVTAGK